MCKFFSKSKTQGQITEELAALAIEVWSGKYKSVAPRDFRSAFGQEYKIFASYEQQDSHEFLVHLVDVLHSELQIPMDDVRVLSKFCGTNLPMPIAKTAGKILN